MAKDTANGAPALNINRDFLSGSAALRGQKASSLGGLVEGEIIPRLLMAHRHECPRSNGCSVAHKSDECVIDCEEAARFAPLPLTLEADELLAEVDAVIDRGVPIESIFVDLLAPAARRLGELWEDDSCDFVDVTMGLWRLQEVMRVVAMRSPPLVRSIESPPSAVFAPFPGDQHNFGALMVEEVFARAGWASEVLFETKRQEMLGVLAERSFDLIGLTVTNDCPSAAIADFVSAIRSVSRNPAIRVIIGGRAINANPGLSAKVGADGTASDACSALVLAERMVADVRPLIGQI